MRFLQPSGRLRWILDRLQMAYLGAVLCGGCGMLWYSYRRASSPILRQQLKWVTRGTILAIAPYTLFYVVPFLHRRAAHAWG